MGFLQKIKEWFENKKTYLVAVVMSIVGLTGIDISETETMSFFEHFIGVLESAQLLLEGLGLAALRAGISKAKSGK